MHLKKVGLSIDELKENFSDRQDMVQAILEYERKCFEEIFNEYNFEGWNAIDILLMVSNEINNRFFNVTPSVTITLAEFFPDIFQNHLQKYNVLRYAKRRRRCKSRVLAVPSDSIGSSKRTGGDGLWS